MDWTFYRQEMRDDMVVKENISRSVSDDGKN